MITIDNQKLYKLLEEKDALVKQGRKISSELETIEFKIKKFQDKEKVITAKVEPKELMDRAEEIKKEVEAKMVEFDKVAEEIKAIKLAAIPEKMAADHKALMKLRDDRTEDRNKVALKIQKIKDKAVPIIKKEVTPHLKDFDDIETAELKGGKIIVETFNHMEKAIQAIKAKFNK